MIEVRCAGSEDPRGPDHMTGMAPEKTPRASGSMARLAWSGCAVVQALMQPGVRRSRAPGVREAAIARGF